MEFRFDLVDEPWIPCVIARDGSGELLGVREVLARAAEIREIVDASPIVTAALHRLLLAILHRNFGPQNAEAWAALWERGRWDLDRLDGYFEKWLHRFDLFAGVRPFYQVTSIGFEQAVPIARRVREVASNANSTLFDHTPEAGGQGVTASTAACFIVAHQGFAVGGTASHEKGRVQDKYTVAGPLNRGAVGLLRGVSLFETLMLNLHQYDRKDGEPFPWAGEDLPAWEREAETRVETRYPTGYLDLLTWQSRRLRLHPEADERGGIVVHRAVIMKGYQFPDDWHRRGRETMVAFTKEEKPSKGQDPWPVVRFREDRALWRDSLALFQSVAEQRARPKIVDWIADLSAEGLLPRRRVLAMDFCGLATNRASVNFWRCEHLAVPLAYLSSDELVDRLREGLVLAERIAGALGDAGWRLASLMQAPTSDDAAGRQPRPDVVRAYRDRLATGQAYWSKLEVPFRRFVVDLAEDQDTVDGEVVHGSSVLPRWIDTLRATAWKAFREATGGLDGSARSLKAVAVGERVLRGRLAEVLGGAWGAPERRSA